MRIKWYGTASLMIEGGSTRILVDPYLKKYNPALPPLPVEECAGADAAVITHPHLDHFCDIGAFLDAGLKKVYVQKTGFHHAEANGIPTDRMIEMQPGTAFTVGKITVRVFPGRHCRFDAGTLLGIFFAPRTWHRAKDAIALIRGAKRFHLALSDICTLEFSHGGKSIMVLGSAGTDKKTEYPTGAELLVFPYQGRKRMYRYMQPILKKFQPQAVMADHFDDAFPPITDVVDMSKFAPAVQEALPGARVIIPEEGTWYEV